VADLMFAGDDDANTPLTPEEREGLIPAYITVRRDLNEAEQANIADALAWVRSRSRNVLDEAFLRTLHKRMFGQVWRWAAQYRQTGRSIGVEAWRVPLEMAQAVDDARFWMTNAVYGADELAVRFSHRIVAIHPFPNGNGRWSRLAGDLLARQQGRAPFTWGRISQADPDKGNAEMTRKAYIEALRRADSHDVAGLLAFARS
jgi:Fic-DOC domain mobile mystery protein B